MTRVSAIATSPSAAPRSAPKRSPSRDNAIIPLKERVVGEFYDPLNRLLRIFKSKDSDETA